MYCEHGILGWECPICHPIYAASAPPPPPPSPLDGLPGWIGGARYDATNATCFLRVNVPRSSHALAHALDLEIEPEQLAGVIELLSRLQEQHQKASRLIDVPS